MHKEVLTSRIEVEMATLTKVLLSLVLTFFLINGFNCENDDLENDTRVVGGSPAVLGQIPYQAAILTAAQQLICGGSIIHSSWILTAAHCSSTNAQLARVGSITYNTGGALHTIVKRIAHSNYDPSRVWNDIALFKVSPIIFYNANVKPIELPTINAPGGILMLLSGWGQTSHPGSIPTNLQFLPVTTITNRQCSTTWSSVTDENICTLQGAGKGACMGDSGGPLAYQNKIHGIVSYGAPCAINKPDVFVRVYKYRFWIIWTMIAN